MQYNQVEESINFRTVKTKDEVTGEITESKRDVIKLQLPVPTWESVIAMIEAGTAEDATEIAKNNLQLVADAMKAVVNDVANSLAKENTSITSANFPYEELDWVKIANQPEAERKSRGISKDEWADFAEDYMQAMPAITGKDEERVKRALAMLINKFTPIKSDKESIKVVREQLVVYAEQAPSASNNFKVVEFLLKKADALLEAEVVTAGDF